MAGSINACDNRAAERERAQDREEERVRKAERDAEKSAQIQKLEEQLESARSLPVTPPPSALEDEAKRREVKALLSAMAASATAKPAPPSRKCSCKPDDPLCDCL